jgi:hypothetical protein
MRAYVDAVSAGKFDAAAQLYLELPYPERVPLWARAIRDSTNQRVTGFWRASVFDRLATYLFWEGGKGAWRIQLDGNVVLYGFDDDAVASPELTPDDHRLLRKVNLI